MGRSPLTDRVELTSESSPRSAKIDRFIVHHAATTSLSAILSLFQPGGRTVSANYALGSDGTLVNCVDESRRAWTSASSAWDGRAVTIEVANSVAGGSWPVSDAAFDKLARLIADVSLRHGFPVNDDTVLTHQELYKRFGASYATACPGDLQRRKPELLALANKYRAGGSPASGGFTPIEEGDDVKVYPHRVDARTGKGEKVVLAPQKGSHLKLASGSDMDVTSISDEGYVAITANVYAKAAPGEAVDITVNRYNPTTGKTSPFFTERAVADHDGTIMSNPTFQFPKNAGWRCYVHVYAPSSNEADVSVSRLEAEAIMLEPR